MNNERTALHCRAAMGRILRGDFTMHKLTSAIVQTRPFAFNPAATRIEHATAIEAADRQVCGRIMRDIVHHSDEPDQFDGVLPGDLGTDRP